MTPTARRQARRLALQVLYEYDTAHHDVDTVLQRHLAERPQAPEVADFARELIVGTLEHVDAIDARIQAAASDWPLAQMARIDKSVLRLAIYEIVFNNAVPAKAAINEAVELAKAFGSETSSRFVNGVLGTIFSQAQESPPSGAGSEVL